ncbi:MAG: hypothetical protein ACE5IR_27730 [bacterium]
MADHPASLILRALEPVEAQEVSWACRHILPNDCPDILHIMVKSRDQVGSFTLSMGHGNAERRAVFLLENGSMMLDLGRQVLQTNTGRGPYNFIKKTVSGLNQGCQLISGTFRNIVQVATGKLRRDPGIFKIVHNFYQTIRGEEHLLVTRETALRVTQLLEHAWNELPVDGLLPKLESQPQQTGENFELEARE